MQKHYLLKQKKRFCVLSQVLLQVIMALIMVEILQTLIVLCLEPNQKKG